MNVGELFVTLGFNADTVKVKEFASAIGNLPIDIATGIAALAGIDYELIKVTQDALAAAVGFQMFSSETGLSWQELQKWQIVAQQANVSAEAVAQSVSSLQRNMAEIQLGRGNIAPFQILGISAHQDAFAVLRQLRERIRGLQPAMATNLISQMGIDPSMIHLLQLTDQEFARLSKTVAGMTGQQEGSFLVAKQELVQFGLVAKYLGFEVAGNLIWALQTLYDKMKQFKVIAVAVGLVLAGLAAYFFPVTAAIIGLILVLDDLSVYFQGGDSVIGKAIEGIKKLGAELQKNLGGLSALGKIAGVVGLMTNPIGTVSGAVGSAAGSVIRQAVTVNVNSAAPAHDVAKEVKAHIDRAASQAALQSNQAGY